MRTTALLLALALLSCSSEEEGSSSSSSSSSGGSNLQLAGTGSFSGDVVPIVRNSCAFTSCHAAKQSNLGIHLTHDATQIYAELQKESPTFPGSKFVVAGSPDQSFLVKKIEATQGSAGAEMPPGELLPKEHRDLIKKWIQNGAKND